MNVVSAVASPFYGLGLNPDRLEAIRGHTWWNLDRCSSAVYYDQGDVELGYSEETVGEDEDILRPASC